MSNTEELVKNYIQNYFDLKLNDEIEITCLFDGGVMTYTEFREHLKQMFAFNPMYLAKEWYDETVKNKLGDFYQYLNKCKVSLGLTSWTVHDEEGIEVTRERLINIFGLTISTKVINSYYDKWYDDAVIYYTEKNMGFTL